MKLALFLDCYGVLYISPVSLYTDRYPQLEQAITDLYKAFNFGSISTDAFIEELANISSESKADIQNLFNKGLVLNLPLIKLIDKRLSGMYDLYVLSNTTQQDLNRLCDIEELRHLPIRSWYSSELLGATKPSKKSFDAARNRIGDVEEVVLVDDLKQNIDGAILAGWSGVQYNNVEDTVSRLEEVYNARVA